MSLEGSEQKGTTWFNWELVWFMLADTLRIDCRRQGDTSQVRGDGSGWTDGEVEKS
jgi:hypothetical protein